MLCLCTHSLEAVQCTLTSVHIKAGQGQGRGAVAGRGAHCAFFRSLKCVRDSVHLTLPCRHWRVFYRQSLWERHMHQRHWKFWMQLQWRLWAGAHDELRRQVILPWDCVIFLWCTECVSIHSRCVIPLFILSTSTELSQSLFYTLVSWQQPRSGSELTSVIFSFFKSWLHFHDLSLYRWAFYLFSEYWEWYILGRVTLLWGMLMLWS